MVDVTIRMAELDDLDALLSLADELALSDLPYDKQVQLDWAHSDKGIEYFKQKIEEKEAVCLVALHNNKLIGYATGGIKNIPSYRLIKVAELENILVSHNFRNKGIGKLLVQTFLDWATEQGADKASVSVFSSNVEGISFYIREGFAPYDLTLEIVLK